MTGRGNNWFKGGRDQAVQVVLPLGTGAVSTQTKAIAVVPKNCRVTGIRLTGSAGVTGTSITAEVHARTAAGAAGNTLQSAATDVKFANEAAARTGVAASLTATKANLLLRAGQMLQVVVTASSITAGPGDVVVTVLYEPR
jgi:hypothetical protein